MKKKTLFAEEEIVDAYVIVDGNFYLHRSKYAYAKLVNKNGQHTGVLFGFFRLLFQEIREHMPPVKKVYVVFDGAKGSAARKKIYAEYKNNRQKHEALIWAQDYITRLCNALEWRVFVDKNCEGDDVIHALANKLQKKGPVYIFTRDKDMFACIKDNVFVFDPIAKVIFDKELFKQKWGIPVNKLRMFLSLQGDKTDCIPGVTGIGAKRALVLCKQFKSKQHLLTSDELNKVQKQEFKLSNRLVEPLIDDIMIPKFKRTTDNAEAHRILKYFEVRSLVTEFHNRGVTYAGKGHE